MSFSVFSFTCLWFDTNVCVIPEEVLTLFITYQSIILNLLSKLIGTCSDKEKSMQPSAEHYIDVIMTTMASQITSLTVVYSIVYSDADQRKHQSSASLAFCGEFTGTGEFPAQIASNAENVSIDDTIMVSRNFFNTIRTTFVVPWNAMELEQHTLEFHGIPYNLWLDSKFHGFPKFHGIPWNLINSIF